jgi:putative ATPase
MPNDIKGTTLYEPGNNAREKAYLDFLKLRWKDKYGY